MATVNYINEQTAAVTTDDIGITQDEGIIVVFQSGLGTGESIVIEQKVNGNYVPIVESGAAIVLDEDNTNQACRGPAVVRLVKGVTAGAVSVDIITRAPSA